MVRPLILPLALVVLVTTGAADTANFTVPKCQNKTFSQLAGPCMDYMQGNTHNLTSRSCCSHMNATARTPSCRCWFALYKPVPAANYGIIQARIPSLAIRCSLVSQDDCPVPHRRLSGVGLILVCTAAATLLFGIMTICRRYTGQ